MLARQMSQWGLDHLSGDVELIVSELVTNATQHAGGVRSIAITARDGYIRVEVADPDPTPPSLRSPGTGENSGRGLLLVAALSRAWGVRPEGDGKVVWAEVRTDED